MALPKFPLEHFYYGQTVVNNKPAGPAQLLAASAGIAPDFVSNVVELVKLPPSPVGELASWGLVRGNRKIPYIVAQSQIGAAGQVVTHYINMPSEVLRGLGGNIRTLAALIENELPIFSQNGYRLKPLDVDQREVDSDERQIDDILDLMTMTRNKLDIIEQLLAALVQNQSIAIKGAPQSTETRVNFTQGLLALLPPSVRFAVTFATRSTQSMDVDVQLRFFDDGTPPESSVVYPWGGAKWEQPTIDDDYSRFVISQLRLDTMLVIERTRALTTPTGWRMRQGSRLAEALSYGSYRLKVDNALMTNLPVDKDDVEKILSTDPTLSPELRRQYALHLIKFSLAMDSIEQADVVMELFKEHPELEHDVLNEVSSSSSPQAYRLISRWLQGSFTIHQRGSWEARAADMAQSQIEKLVNDRDVDGINAFLTNLSHNNLNNERVAMRIIDLVMPFSLSNSEVAENLLLFACVSLPMPMLRRVLGVKGFSDRLNAQTRQLLGLLGSSSKVVPPKGILVDVAQTYGEEMGTIVLARLCELAQALGRMDLLDEQVMRGIARLAASPRGAVHADRIRVLAARIPNDELITLGRDAAYQQLRVRLSLGDYAEVASMLVQQSIALYPGDLQIKYISMIERLFAETPIPADRATRALAEIQVNGIKGAPLLMAMIGIVGDRPASLDLDKVALRAEEILSDEPIMLDVVPPEAIINLMQYHARAHNLNDVLRIAELATVAADRQNSNALELSGKMYQVLDRDDQTRAAGLDLLRSFVRRAEDRDARQAIVYYGRELGPAVRNALQATYFVARIMPDIIDFARNLQIATLFLYDCALPYTERNTPEINALNTHLGRMTGSYSVQERREVPRLIIEMARALVKLNQVHQTQRNKDVEGLIKGRVSPTSPLDLMRVMAGVFTSGRGNPLKFASAGGNVPIGDRSRKVLRSEIEIALQMFKQIIDALPTAKPIPIGPAEVRAELESQMRVLDEQTRGAVMRIMSNDLQRFADLVEHIATNGDIKVLEDESNLAQKIDRAKQKPRSALEFMRFLSATISLRG